MRELIWRVSPARPRSKLRGRNLEMFFQPTALFLGVDELGKASIDELEHGGG
jgi:hypothetical protein